MRVSSSTVVNDDSPVDSVPTGTSVVQQFDSSGTIVVHGERGDSSGRAGVPAALASWHKPTMAGTKAGGVQSRPLFAGLCADRKAIRSRSPASAVHVALRSRQRGWRSTRAKSHQCRYATLLQDAAHAACPQRLMHPSLLLSSPHMIADQGYARFHCPPRVAIVAVKLCLHKRPAAVSRRKMSTFCPANLGRHLRQIRDLHCLACAPEATWER